MNQCWLSASGQFGPLPSASLEVMSRLDPDFSEARTEILDHLTSAHRTIKALNPPSRSNGRQRHAMNNALGLVERAITALEDAD